MDSEGIEPKEVFCADRNHEEAKQRRRSTPWNIGCSAWCNKYFCEGQVLAHNLEESCDDEKVYSTWGRRLVDKYRRHLSLFIPGLIVHCMWWSVMVNYNLFYLFKEKYVMTITMLFGSIIAGMTSEGGGAVAFPVMTLLVGISPIAARDFSVIIQAVGMTGAMFAILFMQVQIEWQAIILGTLGGAIGLILGLEYVDTLISARWKKMVFVSVWFSFAFALFLLNRYYKRKTYRVVPYFKIWKGLVLVIAGVIGGGFSSFAGSGIDICMFSVLTLLFRVTEKTATPTSVVMMAINTMVGTFWRCVIMGEVETFTYEYVAVCIPVVVLGAPLGSILGSHFHRQVLAALVYILDTITLIMAFVLVPQTPLLAGASVALILVGFIFFYVLTKVGHILMERQNKQELEINKTKKRNDNEGTINDAYDCIEEVTIAHL